MRPLSSPLVRARVSQSRSRVTARVPGTRSPARTSASPVTWSASSTSVTVSRRIKSKHKGVKFPCDQCNYKATQRGHLLRHIKSIHDGVKFPCDQCDYKATQKGDLLRHIKSKHEGVKFLCVQCDYKATRKDNLLCHLKSKHE